MSRLAEIYRLFPRRITAGFVFPICNSVGVFLRKYVNSKPELGIYTGTSCCIVKLPDEECVSHTKRVGEIKKLYNYSSQSATH